MKQENLVDIIIDYDETGGVIKPRLDDMLLNVIIVGLTTDIKYRDISLINITRSSRISTLTLTRNMDNTTGHVFIDLIGNMSLNIVPSQKEKYIDCIITLSE